MKEPIHKIGRIFSWIDKQLFWSSQFNTFLIEVNIYKEIKVKKLHIPSLNIQQLRNIDSHNLRIAIYVNVKLLQFQTYFSGLIYLLHCITNHVYENADTCRLQSHLRQLWGNAWFFRFF